MPPPAYMPRIFCDAAPPLLHINFKHYANPMVHPVMGKTISSYKKLMNNPATPEVWQMAFGKDFGGMAQGDNKTGQKGMNVMFMMTHMKLHTHIARRNFLRLQIWLSTTNHKTMILIDSGLRPWAI